MISMRFSHFYRHVLPAAMIALLLPCGAAYADFTQIQPFHFGRWVLTNNDAEHNITVPTSGMHTNSSSFIVLDDPQPAIYEYEGIPTGITPTVTTSQPDIVLQSPGQPDLVLDNFTFHATAADINQISTITIGGRLRTSGDGATYGNHTYTGTFLLEIEYDL